MKRMRSKVSPSEFLEKIIPAAKGSRLAPYWDDIKTLRGKKCTLSQICDFLALNDVEMSVAGLSKYISRREATELSGRKSQTPKPTKSANSTTSATASPITDDAHIEGETVNRGWSEMDLAGLTRKQKGERIADQFVNNTPSRLFKNLHSSKK
jgi:hypothetical protein